MGLLAPQVPGETLGALAFWSWDSVLFYASVLAQKIENFFG
jgi:hypothetical protein